MKNTGEFTWIPSIAGRRLAAHVHGPEEGPVRGVITVVSPVGRDRAVTYRGLRYLAVQAAQAGFAVVRFELSGTGESSPATFADSTEPPESSEWSEDIQAVLDWCEQTWQVHRVAGVGLLIGATLLAASEDPRWSVRLLWDPLVGQRFLRQGAMLRMISVPGKARTKGVEHPGAWYSPARVEEIRSLPKVSAPQVDDVEALAAGATEALTMVVRSGEDEARYFHGVASLLSRVPVQRIARIVALFEQTAHRLDTPQGTFHPCRETEIIGPGGRRLVESLVQTDTDALCTVTRPAEPQEGDVHRAALMVAAASEPKDGPTALWVEASRRLASHGITAMRVERPGCGEMGDPAAEHEANPHTADVVEAVRSAARWLDWQGESSVTGIGLCSGAWAVLSAAEEPLFDEVVAINNLAWRTDLAFHRRMYDEGLLNILPESEELAVVDAAQEQAESPGKAPGDLARRAKDRLRTILQESAPYPMWRWVGAQGLADVPEILLRRVDSSTGVHTIFGPEDWQRFTQYRGVEGARRVDASRRARLTAVEEPALDHSLLADAGRRRTIRLLEELLGA